MKSNYIVTMSYPSDLFFDSNIERRIVRAAGRSGGSGMGLGRRDHSWYNLNKTQAIAKKAKLAALKVGEVEYREADKLCES